MIQLRNMPTKKGLSFYLYAGLGRKSWGRTYCGMRKILQNLIFRDRDICEEDL